MASRVSSGTPARSSGAARAVVARGPASRRLLQGGDRAQQEAPRAEPGGEERGDEAEGDEDHPVPLRRRHRRERRGGVERDGHAQGAAGAGHVGLDGEESRRAVRAGHLEDTRPGLRVRRRIGWSCAGFPRGGQPPPEPFRRRLAGVGARWRLGRADAGRGDADEDAVVAIHHEQLRARRQADGAELFGHPFRAERGADGAERFAAPDRPDRQAHGQAAGAQDAARLVLAHDEAAGLERQPMEAAIADEDGARRRGGRAAQHPAFQVRRADHDLVGDAPRQHAEPAGTGRQVAGLHRIRLGEHQQGLAHSLDHALLPRRGVGQDAPRLVLRRRLALRAQFRHRGDQQQHRRQQRDGHQQEEALDEIEGGTRHRVFLSEAQGQDPAVDHEISIRDACA